MHSQLNLELITPSMLRNVSDCQIPNQNVFCIYHRVICTISFFMLYQSLCMKVDPKPCCYSPNIRLQLKLRWSMQSQQHTFCLGVTALLLCRHNTVSECGHHGTPRASSANVQTQHRRSFGIDCRCILPAVFFIDLYGQKSSFEQKLLLLVG